MRGTPYRRESLRYSSPCNDMPRRKNGKNHVRAGMARGAKTGVLPVCTTFARVMGTATLEELRLCAELRSADALVRIADALEALAATAHE